MRDEDTGVVTRTILHCMPDSMASRSEAVQSFILRAVYGMPFPRDDAPTAKTVIMRMVSGDLVSPLSQRDVTQQMREMILASRMQIPSSSINDFDANKMKSFVMKSFDGMPLNAVFGDPLPGSIKMLYVLTGSQLLTISEYASYWVDPVQPEPLLLSPPAGAAKLTLPFRSVPVQTPSLVGSKVFSNDSILQCVLQYLDWVPAALRVRQICAGMRAAMATVVSPRVLLPGVPPLSTFAHNAHILSGPALHMQLKGLVRSTSRRLLAVCLSTDPLCTKVQDRLVASIASSCHHIRMLSLSNCCNLSDTGLHSLALHPMPHLQSLHLCKLRVLTDVTLGAILFANPLITDLDLSDCTQITDIGVQAIARALNGLSILHLKDCHQVTNEGVGAVLARFHNTLRLLSLWACHRLTQGLFTHAATLPHLRSLNIWGCFNMNDCLVGDIASIAPALQELNCRYMMRMTDSSWIHSVSALRLLRHLNIRQCWKLTSASFLQIAHLLQNLESLDVSQLPNLTVDCVSVLVVQLPLLRELKLMGNKQLDDPSRLLGVLTGFPKRGAAIDGKLRLLDLRQIPNMDDAVGRLEAWYYSSGIAVRKPRNLEIRDNKYTTMYTVRMMMEMEI